MYSLIKDWITSIVMVIIFLALTDMILPSGSLKKYTKLVTGFIVILVIVKPVFSIFGSTDILKGNFEKYMNTSKQIRSVADSGSGQIYSPQTLKAFNDNLKVKINEEITKECKKNYVVSKLQIDENQKSNNFLKIKYIELKEKSEKSSIVKVEKIDLNDNVKKDEKQQHWDKEIARVLVKTFGINESDIRFVR